MGEGLLELVLSFVSSPCPPDSLVFSPRDSLVAVTSRDNWKYKILQAVCIGASCGAVASTHLGASREWTVATFWINFVTLLFFGVDVFVQMIPDPAGYFRNPISLFDLFITLLGRPDFLLIREESED